MPETNTTSHFRSVCFLILLFSCSISVGTHTTWGKWCVTYRNFSDLVIGLVYHSMACVSCTCCFCRMAVCACELCAYELLRDLDESYGCDCGFWAAMSWLQSQLNENIQVCKSVVEEKEQIMSYLVLIWAFNNNKNNTSKIWCFVCLGRKEKRATEITDLYVAPLPLFPFGGDKYTHWAERWW